VRVAAPLVITDDAVRLAVIDKLAWIKRQKVKFADQSRQSRREMVNGESHYFLGRRYRLRVHDCTGRASIAVRGSSSIALFVPPGTDVGRREAILLRWYRQQLKSLISPLLEKWEPILGVQVADWGIKKMKTKWGSCNPTSRRLWFNLELVKKPPTCLEYIVVHEALHLRVRHHDAEFTGLLDQYLSTWRQARDLLNQAPLGHEEWD
jgi:predicted metal-dependent hydrolase